MAKKSKKQRARARKKAESAQVRVVPPPPAELESGIVLKAAAVADVAESPEAPEVVEVAELVAAGTLSTSDGEHRASKRISLQVELHLASDSHFFSGLSGDISEGGVFVSTYRALAQGSLVDLEFSLPGNEQPLHARGEVRWHRDATPQGPPPGVGISFDELSDDDRKAIHRFCTMRPPLYYDDVG
jgi:uncharacterized protein (TIGR02266 family)